MQSFRNSCQRLHQTGQEEIDSVCFYEECQIRLACVNCLRDDFHQGHNSDLRQFNHLKVYLETGIKDYQNAGILDLINQKKQQFQNSKSEIIKALDCLEGNFLKIIARATEADKFIRESIKIIETKEFSLFKETQAQVLVDLQYNKITERLKNLLQVPQIIEELQIIHQSIKSKLEQVKINAFLQTHCQNALQIETFQKNRLNYDSEIVKEMKLIIEEFNQEKEVFKVIRNMEEVKLYFKLGILINKDSEEITEGIWENNNLKWGLTLVKENEEKYFIYIGFYQNGRYEGKGVQKWSDGRRQFNMKFISLIIQQLSQKIIIIDLKEAPLMFQFPEKLDQARKSIRIYDLIKDWQKSMTVPQRLRVPVIVGIKRFRIGGGIDLITSADIRYCTEDAKFTIKEIDIGMYGNSKIITSDSTKIGGSGNQFFPPQGISVYWVKIWRKKYFLSELLPQRVPSEFIPYYALFYAKQEQLTMKYRIIKYWNTSFQRLKCINFLFSQNTVFQQILK